MTGTLLADAAAAGRGAVIFSAVIGPVVLASEFIRGLWRRSAGLSQGESGHQQRRQGG